MRILLIGMPTCGKSRIGKKLSKKFNHLYIDQDEAIEDSQQVQLNTTEDIFTEKNHTKIINNTIKNKNLIMASGGCYGIQNNISNDFDLTIFLNISKTLVIERIINARKQPLKKENKRRKLIYMNDNINSINNTKNILKIYNERNPIYLKNADISFSYNTDEEQLKTVEDIINYISKII